MADVKKLREGTVADAEKELTNLSDAELQELHDAEDGDDNPRSTLLDAIHREQDGRKANAGERDNADGNEMSDSEARFATMTAKFD